MVLRAPLLYWIVHTTSEDAVNSEESLTQLGDCPKLRNTYTERHHISRANETKTSTCSKFGSELIVNVYYNVPAIDETGVYINAIDSFFMVEFAQENRCFEFSIYLPR